MRKSEAIRTIETFSVLIDLQYLQAKQVVSEIARQRNNRVITISPKIGRERQRRLRKPHISKYRNCIEIERITLKLHAELYECLAECAKESRTLVNVPDLIDFIINNECIELANELRIIERRWNCVMCSIDSILSFDNVPDKMKTLLFDYKSEMQLFGNDLHLLDRVWTISDEEATRQMLSQDWKETREADTNQPSWEYIRYISNKVDRILDEQKQSAFLIVSDVKTVETHLPYSDELLRIFKGNKEMMDLFLTKIIDGLEGAEIVHRINYLVGQGYINKEDSRKPLWRVLHDEMGLYKKTYQAYNKVTKATPL